ncbi:DegV family protein [Nocardioides sp. zg-DK7169]|uniref:DegV family protein n=1 Tax=Nocardioides sp. zg-DK7169 TaxID=2736600 RepID=UPI0015580449|nr:DegV family protein [Nocardioides sp. zg-DK7169]NPC98382.1 DegV family protein [Nocardioides sp. zg-DK7169]
MPVRLVTDSTAMLEPALAAAHGIAVVPLQVVIGPKVFDEGTEDACPEVVAQALRDFTPVSTSRPAPAVFADTYRRLAEAGATEVVSVHLSAEMSGTFESVQLAARDAGLRVVCVDTRQVGPAVGYAVRAAAEVIEAGGSADEAAQAARDVAAGARSLFYVDTLEYLRRGGRIGAAAALLGSALAVKPLLGFDDGRVVPLERVRTSTRALNRLEELAVAAAGEQQVDVTVAHLANPDRAAALTERLTARLADGLSGREVACGELGAVLGAHVGPGMIAVCVAPRPTPA